MICATSVSVLHMVISALRAKDKSIFEDNSSVVLISYLNDCRSSDSNQGHRVLVKAFGSILENTFLNLDEDSQG